MKKEVLVGLVCALALCMSFVLVGCGEENKDPEPIQVTDSGWYAPEPNKYSNSSYVHYGVSIYNPNDNYAGDYATVTITGKDENGKILFSDKQVMGVINPHETITFGTQAGNGTKPATVEFAAYVKDSDWNKVNKDKIVIPSCEITETNDAKNSFGDVSFTGKLKVDDSWGNKESAYVSALLKDENGETIAGYNSFVNVVKGDYVPFDIYTYDIPEYSSFEIHAYPWW